MATPDLTFIAESLRPLALPIGQLSLDPENAREHDERNLEVIKGSLLKWGQRLPLIVRKSTMIVEAGNGRLEAMRELGWTHTAAVLCDDSEIDAKEFALTDNQSAALASWDYEQLADTLGKLGETVDLDEMTRIGFSADELEVLLAADWSPPAIDPDAAHKLGDGATGVHSIAFELGDDDFEEYKGLIEAAKKAMDTKAASSVFMRLLRSFDGDA